MRKPGKGFSGRLEDMMLADLLQALQIGKKSAMVRVHCDHRDGSIVMKNGELLTASLGDSNPEQALLRMFTWKKGNFRVDLREVDQSRDFDLSGDELIQMGNRHCAEWDRIAVKLPDMETKITSAKGDLSSLSVIQRKQLQELNGHTTLVDFIEGFELPDLEALQITADLLGKGLIVKAGEGQEDDAGTMAGTVLSRHEQYIRAIQTFLNTEPDSAKKRKVDRRKKDRRSGSERRAKSRRLSDYVGDDNITHLNRTELLMIREKLSNGNPAVLNSFFQDIHVENANR
jgi:hypothetical protein